MAEQNVRQTKGVGVTSSLPAALTTGAGMNRKSSSNRSARLIFPISMFGGLEPQAHMTPLPEWLTTPDCPSGAGWDLYGVLP